MTSCVPFKNRKSPLQPKRNHQLLTAKDGNRIAQDPQHTGSASRIACERAEVARLLPGSVERQCPQRHLFLSSAGRRIRGDEKDDLAKVTSER